MITSINEFKKYLNESVNNLNRYVYHASNINNRNIIEKNGLIPYRGVQWMEDTEIKGKAVFATNSDKSKEWFESTYDDDVWQIDTTKIPNVKWKMDPNFDHMKDNKHIYTQQPIPRNAITLFKIGTGRDMLDESLDIEKIWTGEEVNNHITQITPDESDVPDHFMDKLISHRKFKIQKINLKELLNTDPIFKDYYESEEERYNEDEMDYNTLHQEIVVVDGKLLDGYSRCSKLLRMGEQTTEGFIAI